MHIDKIIDLVKDDNDDLYKIASDINNKYLIKVAISQEEKEYAERLAGISDKIMQRAAQSRKANLLKLYELEGIPASVLNKLLMNFYAGGAAESLTPEKTKAIYEFLNKPIIRNLGISKQIREKVDPSKPSFIYAGPQGGKSLDDALVKAHEAFELQGFSGVRRRPFMYTPEITLSELVDLFKHNIENPAVSTSTLNKYVRKIIGTPLGVGAKGLERLENAGLLPPVSVPVPVAHHSDIGVLQKEKKLLSYLKNRFPDISDRPLAKMREKSKEYEALEHYLSDPSWFVVNTPTPRAQEVKKLFRSKSDKVKNVARKIRPALSTLASKAKKLMSRFV